MTNADLNTFLDRWVMKTKGYSHSVFWREGITLFQQVQEIILGPILVSSQQTAGAYIISSELQWLFIVETTAADAATLYWGLYCSFLMQMTQTYEGAVFGSWSFLFIVSTVLSTQRRRKRKKKEEPKKLLDLVDERMARGAKRIETPGHNTLQVLQYLSYCSIASPFSALSLQFLYLIL